MVEDKIKEEDIIQPMKMEMDEEEVVYHKLRLRGEVLVKQSLTFSEVIDLLRGE